MRLSIISDEISRDPMTAAELAAEWGIPHLELRSFYGTRAPRGMSAGEIESVAKAARAFGLDVPSISPGLFKIRLEDEQIEEHRGDLRVQCLDMCEVFGASMMVVFPHIREAEDQPDDQWPDVVVEDLQQTADLAAERGISVALETEKPCYGASGQSMAKLLDEIDRPNCGANWDPQNHFSYNGESFRPGYEALGDRIIHVHVKDALIDEDGQRRTVVPGEGAVDWEGQIAELVDDGYDGLVVIETHFAPKVAASRACAEAMRALLANAGVAVE
ncbi:MAG: sugar phosphate isomerase/epimerase family protein [Armatimonadota bacterium]|jgi:sugar phosphate isomerase/epimerase